MTTQTDTATFNRPPCDCIDDNAPCHHGPRYAMTTDTAPLSGELTTITIRYRVTKEEARALMANERARTVSWGDVFGERDAAEARATQAEAERDALLEAQIKVSECLEAHANYWRHAIYPTDFRQLRNQLFDTIGILRALSPAQPAQDRIAAASAYIDRNGPVAGADRFEGPEVSGPAQGADIARELDAGASVWGRLCDHYFAGESWEMDYPTFLDMGRDAGLLADAVYDPDVHGPINGDVEAGETVHIDSALGRKLRDRARSAGLLTTETEGGNG